ncbi:MAG: hypothetical protein AAF432_01570 [Planctomycetota bacterium]
MQSELLQRLNDRIQAIQQQRGRSSALPEYRHADRIGRDETPGTSSSSGGPPAQVPTNAPAHASNGPGTGHDVDRRLWQRIALMPGMVHEWFGQAGAQDQPYRARVLRPPLCMMVHLARHAVMECPDGALVIWIGRACWPYAELLAPSSRAMPIDHDACGDQAEPRIGARIGRGPDLRPRSLFIDPHTDAERLWTIDLAARSPSVAAVFADGRGFGLAETRRLQLAAKGSPVRIHLARAANEERALSASGVRWHLAPTPSSTSRPRWHLTLRRLKASATLRQLLDREPSWLLEWNHASRTVAVPARVVRGSRATTPASRPVIIRRRSA